MRAHRRTTMIPPQAALASVAAICFLLTIRVQAADQVLLGLDPHQVGISEALSAGVDGPVKALVVYNGQLIAAGSFHSAGGVSARHIARWTGAEWLALGPGTNGEVTSLTMDDV